MLERPESKPRKIILVYVNIHPIIIRLLSCGLDIFIYLWLRKCILIPRNVADIMIPRTAQVARIAYTVLFTWVCSIITRVLSLGGCLKHYLNQVFRYFIHFNVHTFRSISLALPKLSLNAELQHWILQPWFLYLPGIVWVVYLLFFRYRKTLLDPKINNMYRFCNVLCLTQSIASNRMTLKTETI